MKKTLVYLVLVLLVFSACSYFTDDTIFEMDPFDQAACFTVDGGLVGSKTLKANMDPNFLDDKVVNALIANADEMKTIKTEVKVKIVTGDVGAAVETQAFAMVTNYYDSIAVNTEIELYMNKTEAVVDSLLSGQTYDGVKLTADMETDIVAYFDSVRTKGAEQVFVIDDEMSNYDFFKEVIRTSYGKTGKIPVLELGDRSTQVTCGAVEVMSMYSYLNIEEADQITFYFDNYMSMRIWDADGNRIPMTSNSINLEMAAEFGDRADGGSGRVLSKCVYDLEAGTYFVRWIRAESTKSSAQFTTDNPESETNYFKFVVGIFPASYEADPEIVDIASKLVTTTVEKELKSAYQCDTTLWAEDENLQVTDLLRSADKMNALLNGLDSITVEDFDKGLHLNLDPDLPQGIFFLKLEDIEDIDTLRMYVDGGTFTMYKRTADYPSGGKKFNPFSANLIGVTFKEIFVSEKIDNVMYLYNFDENLYIVTVTYAGENDGINMVVKGN
jgi:hypothetical protein